MQNTVCARITVCSPSAMPSVAKKMSVATAEMISGTMSGRLITA